MSDQERLALTLLAIKNESETLPPGPFAELLKRAAHFGQVPECRSCNCYGFSVIWPDQRECTKDESYVDPDHFCAEWNPEK